MKGYCFPCSLVSLYSSIQIQWVFVSNVLKGSHELRLSLSAMRKWYSTRNPKTSVHCHTSRSHWDTPSFCINSMNRLRLLIALSLVVSCEHINASIELHVCKDIHTLIINTIKHVIITFHLVQEFSQENCNKTDVISIEPKI